MKTNEERLEGLFQHLDSLDHIKVEDIPQIDLYMDQVTTFMEKHLGELKRYPEDKVLTKTMINNYAKNNLLPSPVRKKYTQDHILLLVFIYYFKNLLNFNDIETILSYITEHHFGEAPLPLSQVYTEVFTMEQCLYALMLASANDIALQIAEQIGGSVDAFVQKMNDRARELGCTNTVFTNPTGLPDDAQHTTAHDLALIMQAAISNDSFRTISGATSYTIPATNVSGGTRNLTSSFTMTDPASASYYEGCIGGRESTTTASGSVLVTAAQRNGTTLIAVVMNGATGQTANEAISLLDYGFSNFQLLDLSEDDFHILSGGTVMVPSGATADDLTTEDTESDGQILRTYSFGGTQVGTAVVEDSSQESSSDVLENDENMDSAKAYSESRSQIPYFAIGGVGILLLILLLWRMIRIIRS